MSDQQPNENQKDEDRTAQLGTSADTVERHRTGPGKQPIVTFAHALFPGLALAALIAMAAVLIARELGGPVMLLALLLGMALNAFGREQMTADGLIFSSKSVLKLGVA
ncbi:MAG: putative sulfate exporter family transporter, partial [Pseudomonadota bacterium]